MTTELARSDMWAVIDDSIRRAKAQERIGGVLIFVLRAAECALFAAIAIWIIAVGVRLGLSH